jgi:hypothetical protein
MRTLVALAIIWSLSCLMALQVAGALALDVETIFAVVTEATASVFDR